MNFILTLVAADKSLPAAALAAVEAYCDSQKLALAGAPVWLDPHKAADLALAVRPSPAQVRDLRALLAADRVDIFVTPSAGRRKALLLADMDSTIVTAETLDELAVQAGPETGVKIAVITERAMRGEIDFAGALRERVMMLKGLPERALARTREAIAFSPGAKTLVRTMRAHGATCVLVSGGFTFFTGWVAEQAGFHAHHANSFVLANGALSGLVAEPILDKQAKLDFLNDYAAKLKIGVDAAMTVGDGSNDLPMLQAAGLGVGYHPKPLLRETLDNCILYGDLSAALYAQGYTAAEIAAA